MADLTFLTALVGGTSTPNTVGILARYLAAAVVGAGTTPDINHAYIKFAGDMAQPGRDDLKLNRRVIWAGLGDDEEGMPYEIGFTNEGLAQVIGTPASATLTMQWTVDDENWYGMTDKDGNALAFTDVGGAHFYNRAWKIRPVTADGSGTALSVIVSLKGR